jgi:carboxyl-terminal processing protease
MMPAMSDRAQAPQVPVWFLLVVMTMMGLTAAGFLFLGTRLAAGASMPQEEMKVLELVYDHIQDNYVDSLSPDENGKLVHKAIGGLVKGLDRYSEYVPPERVTNFDNSNKGVYPGTGFVMQPKGDKITVYFCFLDGPAARAGLQVGDEIVTIETLAPDGQQVDKRTKVADLVDKSIEDDDERQQKLTAAASNLIRGDPGTPVRLLVKRDDKTFPITITRAKVQRPSIKWAQVLDKDQGIAYVHLTSFVERSVTEFDAAIAVLKEECGGKLRGLILDLRFNHGGILDGCRELTNRFLKEGVIVTLNKGQNNQNGKQTGEHSAEPGKCTLPDLPLVILVNGRSASASEVLSGALQHYGRAFVVGTRSFGKGLVQSIYRLDLNARLKITTSEYRCPGGRNIHRGKKPIDDMSWGIIPDRVVEIERPTRDAIQNALAQNEVPRKYRTQAHALARRLGIPVRLPLPPKQDPQLAAALEEIRKLILKQDR